MDTTHDDEHRNAGLMDGISQHPASSHPSDLSLSANERSHIPSLFHDTNPTNSTAMHLTQTPMNIDPMDTLHSNDRAPAPGFIPDFPAKNNFFGIDSSMGDAQLGGVHTSPSVSTASSHPSHAPSPAANGLSGLYSASSSSLASALDNLGLPGHGAEHSISPGNLANAMNEITFPPSGPTTSNTDFGFQFPPQGFEMNGGSMTKESSPDAPPGGPHLMVVGDILKNIAHTAKDASDWCSTGDSEEAGRRIDELKKTITLVADLIAATRLADATVENGHSSPNHSSSAGSPSNHATPPSAPSVVDLSHRQSPSQFSSPPAASFQSTQTSPMDLSDGTRKRCASSVPVDRVMKALKMTKVEEEPISVPPPPATISPSQILASTPSPPHGSMPASAVDPSILSQFAASNPPSQPGTRPSSSTGQLSQHDFGFLRQQQQPQAPHGPPLGFSPHVDIPSSAGLSHMDLSSPPSATTSTPTHIQQSFPDASLSWTDPGAAFRRQHNHTLSGSSIDLQSLGLAAPASSHMFVPSSSSFAPSLPPHIRHVPSLSNLHAGSGPSRPPLPRQTRSLSVSTYAHPFAFGMTDITAPDQDRMQSRPTTGISTSQSPGSSSQYDNEGDFEYESDEDSWDRQSPASNGAAKRRRFSKDDPRGESLDTPPGTSHGSRSNTGTGQGSDGAGGAAGHGNELPQEFRADVDRIFFEFLNRICSNLEATDSKGEPIHQTLMAKKMQRLDESPDFRPFKFRIQAFTNAFLEELARQGYPEEKIPMKKVRNYLWNQPYISRFNEDGKKAKSKGNHIWNIDAKKAPEGGWIFRPFHRRLAGLPPGVAYVGLRWSWSPRIWDPQGSRTNMPVKYSSPWLPSWLSWNEDVLSGVPPPDAQSCDVTVEARFMQDGQEEVLSQTVHVTIAPMSTVDTTFPPSRRPSMSEASRRGASDSVIPHAGPSRSRAQSLLASAPPVTQDSQVLQVLTTAAQRVAQEAQSQVVSSRSLHEPGPELHSLVKQQHVLTVTAQAVDNKLPDNGTQSSAVLAVAAHQVVLQAARQVAADRSAVVASQLSAGITPSQPAGEVTVTDVSMVTQSAVAQAVEITGPLSTEVDVLMTANSLLQQQQSRAALDPSPSAPPLDALRSQSAGAILSQSFPLPTLGAPMHASSGIFPPPSISEFVPHS